MKTKTIEDTSQSIENVNDLLHLLPYAGSNMRLEQWKKMSGPVREDLRDMYLS